MSQPQAGYRPQVDWPQLVFELDAKCSQRLVSLRTAAKEMHVPVSVLSGFRRYGKGLSANSLARLMVWLYPAAGVPWWVTTDHEREDTEE
jgi:hypothetical protein